VKKAPLGPRQITFQGTREQKVLNACTDTVHVGRACYLEFLALSN